jgi:ElaB/YqjD/DUF883 family membrane-anchored ribosome-binding protein
MGEDKRAGGPAMSTAQQHTDSAQRDPEEIREDIEQTRADLGDTVAALAQKTDVKTRLREWLEHAPQSLREHPVPLAATAVFAVGFVFGRVSSH